MLPSLHSSLDDFKKQSVVSLCGSLNYNTIKHCPLDNFRYADDTTLMAESEEELKAS